MRPFLTFLALFSLFFFAAPILCLSAGEKEPQKPEKPPETQREVLPNTLPYGEGSVSTADLLAESLAAMEVHGSAEEALKAFAVVAATRLSVLYRETGSADGIPRLSPQEAKKQWGDYWFSQYWPQIQEAVSAVWGEVLTGETGLYENAEIFPLSWGFTEAGISCPYDFTAEGFETAVTVSLEDFAEVFPQYKDQLTVKKAQSGRVETVTSGKTEKTGWEIMDRFSLPSPAFTVSVRDSGVRFLCLGKGKGIGMSLYAADEWAKRGKNYREILKIFYPDAVLQEANRSLGSR